jgi:hypothetical protein
MHDPDIAPTDKTEKRLSLVEWSNRGRVFAHCSGSSCNMNHGFGGLMP